MPVSVDLNFRAKLWTEAEAQHMMRPLMPLVDVVIANEEDLQAVLGIEVAHADVTAACSTSRPIATAVRAGRRGVRRAQVAVTLRESLSASDNGWSAVLFDAPPEPSIRASATTCAWLTGSAAATASPRG